MRALHLETARPEFSFVITAYREEACLEEFHARLSAMLRGLGRTYEIIYVSDGSPDGTFSLMERFFAEDPHVSAVLDLYFNAGQRVGLTAGFSYARGEKIAIVDADLQLAPEDFPKLAAEFDKGRDIVSGWRTTRHDSLLRLVMSKMANILLRLATGTSARDFGCAYKIFDAALIRAFEFSPFRVLQPTALLRMGRRFSEVEVSHSPRKSGRSGWTFYKLLVFLVSNLTGLLQYPLQALSLFSFAAASLCGVGLVAAWSLSLPVLSRTTPGQVLLAVVVCLLTTVSLTAAVLEFVIRMFVAGQQHPAYVIRTLRQRAGASTASDGEGSRPDSGGVLV